MSRFDVNRFLYAVNHHSRTNRTLHDEHETKDSDDEEEDEVKNLSFDLDVMDKFTKESNAGISSEDLLCYLISMEFISFGPVFVFA